MSGTPPRELRPTLDADHPLFGLGYAKPVAARSFLRVDGQTVETASATVAEETPVALVYNGRPHVVMMCTPADIEDFARGFTITEEIVQRAADIASIVPVKYSQGIEVAVTIPAAAARELESRGRSLIGRTGCGLCGITTIDDVLRPTGSVAAQRAFDIASVLRAAAELPAFQHFNEGTNAVHAAAWAARDGRIVLAREDVGRHNALDKVIGAMYASDIDESDGFIVVTSRASYELIQKCAVAGIAVLAAISRPTGLAIRMADAAGVALVGLVRGKSANVYSHAERFSL